jgi:hypothetical protein
MELSSKEINLLDTALMCLLDNYMYEPDDFAELKISEADIRDMLVRIFREQLAREKANA